MHPRPVDEDFRLSLWRRVREYAVPPTTIETATARRRSGDWAGACAAARVDVDLRLRDLTRTHGAGLTARVRADLRHLAPDLLRWHMPRSAPDGLLRPGLTVPLARYTVDEPDGPCPVYLVVRTPPAWAAGGQRMSLALWDGDRLREGYRGHPRPRPGRRFRFDLHRHLWDARRAHELRHRSGADGPDPRDAVPFGPLPPGHPCAVDRWADEARILLRDAGRTEGPVVVRLDARRRLLLDLSGDGCRPVVESTGPDAYRTTPLLPDAATYVLPDLALLRAGAIDAGRLHPLVASALAPGHPVAPEPPPAPDPGRPHTVLCQGVPHRVALVDGVLVPLDHTPDEIRREETLAELTGTPLPCLQFVDRAHRRPDCLAGVRERLDHGDVDGALAVVENLLGPDACLRDGPLKDALEEAASRRLAHGLHRAGLRGPADHWILPAPARRRDHRTHPRHATFR
ncbi:hypothetical protein OIE82_01495 [Streptomyces althioticus]|uniref:Uncharacterized protein n=1 Tax=Streptomyces althioticus TaxID=83380 RepID=A0ABZ1XXH7_9ACTN|nr:hypothetical protein GCM10010267_09620 [Streptomyces griseorubens]